MRKQILLAIIMVVTGIGVLSAQDEKSSPFADTLHIFVDDHFRMMILSDNITSYDPADSLDQTIDSFLEDMMKFELPETGGRFIQIFYSEGKSGNSSIRFKDVTDQEKTYIVQDDGETLFPMSIEIIIAQGKATQLHLFFPDITYLDELADYEISGLIADVLAKQKAEIPGIKRIAMTTTWKVEGGRAAEKSSNFYRNTKISDQLELSGTVGASLIRHTLVPSIDLIVAVSIAKKTRIRHRISADFSMNYNFNEKAEGGYSTDINSFIGASYFVNTSKNTKKPYWYGLGVSYLAWRNGEFFDKNTWRLSLGAKYGERFSIMPELYFGDNFKNVMPGLKFRVWF